MPRPHRRAGKLACHLCKQLGHFAKDYPHKQSGSTVPPPPPPPPNVPPPPPLPFNTNHIAMIAKFGGAIWHSVRQVFLPPITEQGIKPFMHMDPVAGVSTLQIDPYVGSSQEFPCIVQLPPTLQVNIGEINLAEIGTTREDPPFSTRAPHGKIKRINPTLKQPKLFKRLQIPLKKRRTTTIFTLPSENTINPLFVPHVRIARKIGVNRYKLARIRPGRPDIDPILPLQGTMLNMIWSWALSIFAPDSLEQQLQYNTQYLPYEPPTWFQGWLFHEWQAKNESSSPASVFANDNFLGPPDSPIPPPPPAPPPMFTGGMASERHRHLRKIWFAGHNDVQPLPTRHIETFALGRVPSHAYLLEIETPSTNNVA